MIYEQETELVKVSDGSSSFIHIKYSDDLINFTDDNGEKAGKYLGVYTDDIEEDSMDFSKYTWKQIVGNGIESVSITYQISSSGDVIPTGLWEDDIPEVSNGEYLWTKNTTIYSDETVSESYSVTKSAENVESEKTVSGDYFVLTDSNNTYSGELTNINGKSEQISVDGNLQGIESVEINSIVSHTRNLFDASKISSNTAGGATITNNDDGSFTIDGSGNLTDKIYSELKYTHNETVKLFKTGGIYINCGKVYPEFRVVVRNSSGATIVSNGYIITEEMLNDDSFYITMDFLGSSGNAIKSGTVKPIVYQVGSSVYEQYEYNETPLYTAPLILRGISDDVYDSYDNGIKTVKVGYIEFDGSDDESWEIDSVGRFNISSIKNLSSHPTSTSVKGNVLCSHFATISADDTYSKKNGISMSTSGALCFYTNKITTIDSWKTYLSSNKIIVLYELAEPVYKPYSLPSVPLCYPTTCLYTDSKIKPQMTLLYSTIYKGNQGRYIDHTEITYQASISGTTIPTDEWLTDIPQVSQGLYLWTKTTTYYSDGTTSDAYSVSLMGKDGVTARTYILSPSTVVIKKGKNDVLSPQNVTFSAFYRDGDNATRLSYSARFIIQESEDGINFTTKYTSSSNETSKLYTPSVKAKVVRCNMYASGGTTTMLDTQSVVIVSDVDGITIGGRNLLLETKTWLSGKSNGTIQSEMYRNFKVLYCDNSSGTSTIDVARWSDTVDIKANTYYTLSFWAKGSGSFSSYLYPNCIASGESSEGNSTASSDGSITHSLTEEWKHYWITWKTLPNASELKNCIAMRLLAGAQGYICGCKLEESNVASDWSPSPDDVDSAIEAVQTTADGKNSVFYSASAPSSTNRKINDIWFDTDDDNKMYYWNGSSWIAQQFGTNAIKNLSITNALIADGTIQNAKIGNVDAAKITTGIISADRIGSRSITADKLVANTITADSGIIADGAITNAKIADASIDNAKIKELDAAKITSGYIDANRISSESIDISKLTSQTQTIINDASKNANNALSSISTLQTEFKVEQGKVSSLVSEVEGVKNNIDNLNFGDRNYVRNSKIMIFQTYGFVNNDYNFVIDKVGDYLLDDDGNKLVY